MLACGKFFDFVNEFTDNVNNDALYEIWLHKIFTKSFEDFKKSVMTQTNNANMTKETMISTIKESGNILACFNPSKEGGE